MAASSNSPDLGAASASSADEAKAPAAPATASPRPAPASEPTAGASESRRGRWVVWLLAFALVLAVLWGLSQGRRAEQLTAEVGRLEAELAAVGADLQAHRVHLDRIRTDVDDLSARALALRELANLEPGAEIATGDAAASSADPESGTAIDESSGEAPADGAVETPTDAAPLPRGAIL